jgi:hypothetical protein
VAESSPGRLVISAVLMHMMHLTGRTMILFPNESARNLCDILMRRAPDHAGVRSDGTVGPQGESNILSAYHGAE